MNTMSKQFTQHLAAIVSVWIFCALLFIKPPIIVHSSATPDVSWPNCKTKTIMDYSSGFIGVNDGLDFTGTPCLSKETTWFQKYALYVNTGYAGDKLARKYGSSPRICKDTDSTCLAYDWGYQATAYSIKYANSMNTHSNEWWLDVETINSWTRDAQVNRASISGALRALHTLIPFATAGIYSTADQWNHLTNSWQISEPIWYAIGPGDTQDAYNACDSVYLFTGGDLWLVQYEQLIDQNVTCSNNFEKQLKLF
jgi:hypothetical protein